MTDKAFLDLLDLQAVDTEIDRLLHRRETLPELDAFKGAHERLSELRSTEAAQDSDLAETTSALNKAEGELELTEQKRGSEEMRMFAGGMSSKDLENLQAEVEMLGRQIETAEEEILAMLERRDEQEAAVTATRTDLARVEAESTTLESSIAGQWKEIDAEVAVQRERREGIAPLVPDELRDLYEDLRARKEGVGVARLLEGVCGGCHLSPTITG